MALLYEKHETPAQVEYRFQFLPVLYLAMVAAALLSLGSRGKRTNEFVGGFGLLFLAWIAGTWKPMMEIQRAMNQGTVEVTGSKFSFSNPARVMFRKQEVLKSAIERVLRWLGFEGHG